MNTPKEILLETIKKDGKPSCILDQYEALAIITSDPVMRYTRGNRVKGVTSKDRWGTTIDWPEDQYAAMPHITDENKVIKDVTNWREEVSVPDLRANAIDWTDALKEAEEIRSQGQQLVTGFMGTGVFEQCHYLMGFEDTLTNLLIEPEAMADLIEAIGEYRLTYAKLLVENLKPDAILSHDDWGSKTSLFMHPDVWREFYKPQYEKIYGYMKENGVIVVHHSDTFCEPIVEDMVELGIDIWQGAVPTNDIPRLQEELGGRMTLMGGIDSVIDRPDTGDEEIRTEVRRVLNEYTPGGHFIPSMTYGQGGSIFPHVEKVITEEIKAFNLAVFG